MASLYHQLGDRFEPTEYARSPWHPGLLHGGSVAALFGFHLARWGSEYADWRMSRLSLDLIRPVPMAPLAMRQQVLRDGRRLKLVMLELYHEERLVARGEALWQRQHPLPLPDYAPKAAPAPGKPEDYPPFSIQTLLDEKGLSIPEGFHTHVQVHPVTPWREQGESTCWLRWPHGIVDGHAVTPLEQACLISDLGNGAGQLNFGNGIGAINADIVLALHRYPAGEWVALHARALFSEQGVGVVHSTLYDEHSAIGHVLQSVQPNGEFDG